MSNKLKTVFIILVGLILVAIGVFASILLFQRLQSTQETVAVEDATVKAEVVIITRDMFLGDRIQAGDVSLFSIPVEVIPRNAITSLEEAEGKIIKTDLIQGEILLAHNLADPTNNARDLSFVLSEDHVMMAFPADDLMSRESIVQRGDIVDIFATFTEEVKTLGEIDTTDESEEPKTRTFTVDTFQKVSVTALVLEVIEEESQANLVGGETDQDFSQPDANIRAYLLALNPQDALILKHLKDIGAVFDIVLRAPTSTIQFTLTPVTEEYIIEFYGLEILP